MYVSTVLALILVSHSALQWILIVLVAQKSQLVLSVLACEKKILNFEYCDNSDSDHCSTFDEKLIIVMVPAVLTFRF